MAAEQAELSYTQATEFLRRLVGADAGLILVGGQAVNFWAEYYLNRTSAPELATAAPYTSKDADFLGDQKALRYCAEKLHGEAIIADLESPVNTGKVVFKDSTGYRREIDFVHSVFGLAAQDIVRTSIPFTVCHEGVNTNARLRVMNPERCMESRACNYVGLPGYKNRHALKQLRASIFCCREFASELIDGGRVRDALGVFERIIKFCTRSLHGRIVLRDSGLDPFDAVFADLRLPDKFATERFTRMKEQLGARRRRMAAAEAMLVARRAAPRTSTRC